MKLFCAASILDFDYTLLLNSFLLFTELSWDETLRPYLDLARELPSKEGDISDYLSNFCLVIPTSFQSRLLGRLILVILYYSVNNYHIRESHKNIKLNIKAQSKSVVILFPIIFYVFKNS